jgi:integrase/recombinase XerD
VRRKCWPRDGCQTVAHLHYWHGSAVPPRSKRREGWGRVTTTAPERSEVVEFDPLKDKTYRRARLGPDVAAFLAWFELGGASPISVDNYERALAVLCRMYPATPIAEVTDAQLAQVFKRFPARSRRVRVAPYRTFFKWARQTRRVTENPMELLPLIRRQPRRRPDVFTDAEVDALLSLEIHDAAPLALLFDAGLRRAEAQRIQMRHCLPGSATVKVIGGKGGKDRVVPMSQRLQTLLADLELLECVAPKEHVFYRVYANAVTSKRLRDKPIGEGTFSRWFHRCLEQAGVPYRNPHTARHTFATTWRRRGLEADDLAILLGHESVRTTSDLYVQIEVADVARRMALIEARELGE